MVNPPDARFRLRALFCLCGRCPTEKVNQMESGTKYVETIVIGGGQAGLVTGHHLAKLDREFLILDANPRVGDAWRNRWESLRLFTPARYCGLPGLPFPLRGDAFPTKDQMADYLEQYAERFDLPVRTRTRVDSLRRRKERFVIETRYQDYEADNVIVAMADYQIPKIPNFACNLNSSIVQLHSQEYRNPSQLQPGPVLIAGVGNSGAEIGIELARTHQVWLAGKETGVIPWRIDTLLNRFVLSRLFRFVFHRVLTLDTPLGRNAHSKIALKAGPLARTKPQDIDAAGIERVPRVEGAKERRPVLADGRVLDAANVIWCTGYQHSFPWIELPIFGEHGSPIHHRGVVPQAPGLYFVGLNWQYAMSSATIIGVSRDAKYVVQALAARPKVFAPRSDDRNDQVQREMALPER